MTNGQSYPTPPPMPRKILPLDIRKGSPPPGHEMKHQAYQTPPRRVFRPIKDKEKLHRWGGPYVPPPEEPPGYEPPPPPDFRVFRPIKGDHTGPFPLRQQHKIPGAVPIVSGREITGTEKPYPYVQEYNDISEEVYVEKKKKRGKKLW